VFYVVKFYLCPTSNECIVSLKSWLHVGSELCECGIILLPHVGCVSCEFELRKRCDMWFIIIFTLCPT